MEQNSVIKSGLTLYRFSDAIYDELIFNNEKKTWEIIRRVGIEKYRLNHGRVNYVTDCKILLYPLPTQDIYEEPIEMEQLKSCSEFTSISILNGCYQKQVFSFDLDKKYKECINLYKGTGFSLPTISYVHSIKNTFPHELIDIYNVQLSKSFPNIVVHGKSTQKTVRDENDIVISPCINYPVDINHINSLSDVTINSTDNAYKNQWRVKQYTWDTWSSWNINTGISPTDRNIDVFVDIKSGKYEENLYDEYLADENELSSKFICGFNMGHVIYRDTYIYVNEDCSFKTKTKCAWNVVFINDELQTQVYNNTNITLKFKRGINHIEWLERTGTQDRNSGCEPSFLTIPELEYMDCKLPNDIFVSEFKLPNEYSLKSIGNYYDKFFRDEDYKWKTAQNIQTYYFTGNETLNIEYTSNNYIVCSATINFPIMDDDTSIVVMSNYFFGISYNDFENNGLSQYKNAVWYKEGKLYFSFSKSDDDVIDFFKNNSVFIEYVIPETIIKEVENQNYYHTISSFDSSYREDVSVDINYVITDNNIKYPVDVIYDETQVLSFLSPISIIPERNYIFKRPNDATLCKLIYYDNDKNIVNIITTTESEITLNIPIDVYYLNIIDYSASGNYSDYSLIESNEFYSSGINEISSIVVYYDSSQKVIDLPHVLYPGDELVYNINRMEWMYYPYSLDDDIIYYKSDPIELSGDIRLLDEHSGVYLQLACLTTNPRPLDKPRNIVLDDSPNSGEYGFGYVTWDEIPGVTYYTISVDDHVVDIIENENNTEIYHFKDEQMGNLTVTGANDLTIGESCSSLQILTVPNTPKLDMIDTVYENNRYYITVKFKGNSIIADNYNMVYSIDGSNPITVSFEHDKIYNSEKIYEFYAPFINNEFVINIESSNEKGNNNYADDVVLLTNKGFSLWTYKPSTNEILLAWNDEFDDESSYSLKYSINQGEWVSTGTDGKTGSGTRLLEYLPLSEDDEMRICIAAVRNGYTNIYTKPITVSKSLDKKLIPPSDFQGTKLSNGKIQFTWTDDYDVDANFELYYIYSDGTSNTIYIPKESATTGQYTYIHNVSTYGFIRAKLRMVWELGESEYSENIIVYNIPIVDAAPPLHHQERTNNKLKISWDIYDFISNYILYFTVDGVQHVIEQVDNIYLWDIPNDKSTYSLNVSVKALFIDGTYTNVSKSLSFTVCNSGYQYDSIVYTHYDKEHKLDTTIMSRGLETPYLMNTLSMNSFKIFYQFIERICRPYLFTDYKFVDNYWGHDIGDAYCLQTNIKSSVQYLNLLNTIVYTQPNIFLPVDTIIYSPASSAYPLLMEITKVVIVCLGDSITAGHPSYWAETNTGIIESQYEYWLARRLKGEYDVINKGYGQEKLIDMVERFERDVVPLNPKYMILHGGTNDWFQDASTHDLETGYAVMDKAKDYVKEIVQKCWDNNIYPIISTLLPRRDITSDGKILWDYFNDWIKTYATEQSILGKDCAYIDFFNAGKDFDPPEPIGDPKDPYKLNPLFDGDNIYDENGNQIRSGLGVHPNPDGYRVMGYSVPLILFATSDSGMKLYRDAQCTIQEIYDTTEASRPFYKLNINNVRRGKEKLVTRYLKNVGVAPSLYYMYVTNTYNVKYYFLDSQGNKTKTITGFANPNIIKPLKLVIESEFDDYDSNFELHIISRELTSS